MDRSAAATGMVVPDWGREFAYSVLGELSPTAVVGVMEELRDLAPIASATGFYRDRIADFRPISRALAQSKSAFMRAFGAQSYFVPWMRAHGANHITAPDDVKGAIADLEQLGLPYAELVLFVEAWTRDWDDDGTRQAVVNCLRDMLCDERTSRELRADVLLNCLSQGRSVVPLLFVDMDGLPEAKARILSRSLLDVLLQWIPVSESERPGRSFYSGYVDSCQAIAKAAGAIAAADSGTPGDVLRAAMDESKLLKLSQSVSPLVPRPGRIAAVSARGWLAICSLLAAAELTDRGLLRAEVEDATGLIDEFGSDLDEEMRAALTKTLN